MLTKMLAMTIARMRVSPIEVQPNQEFGPAALWIAENGGCWVIGRWDGETWHDAEGFRVNPLFCCLLPDPFAPEPALPPELALCLG